MRGGSLNPGGTPLVGSAREGQAGPTRVTERSVVPWKPGNAGGTHRAALGGTLTARELWLRRIWFLLLFVFMLLYGDACQWPYSLWCSLPAGEHGPRGFDLVIGDLPCRVFPVWY